MLADHWSEVGELDKLATAEPGFRTFVLRHIDDLAEQAVLDRAVANAAVRCPKGASLTCAAILTRARKLERELEHKRKERARRPTKG